MPHRPGLPLILVTLVAACGATACGADADPDGARGGAIGTIGATDPRAAPGEKSIAFYVGSGLTADGSVLLAGFGHEPSSHWLEVTPSRVFPAGTTQEVGITAEARLPGRRLRIPQEGRTARFITSNYSEFAGFPPPLTNGGLNEHGVAARTVWSPSRPELVAMTPDPQTGLSYSDLARRVMERATSARHAVRIVGELVAAHGYATYGGNSFLFADATEGWVVITYAGGQRLWAAERLGRDDVRVLYPGYIRDFPVDFRDDPDYLAADHLVTFAVERGWFDAADSERMDLQAVYGTPFPSRPGEADAVFRYPPDREAELRDLAPVALADMIALVRDPRWSDDRAGYGHVAHLRPGTPPELAVLWVAAAPASATPMVPLHIGVRDVPPEYKQHRYMTKGADATFLDPAFASIEASRDAYRTFRRLFYLTCAHPAAFLRPVTAALESFERDRMAELAGLEDAAARRLQAGDTTGARDLLTDRARDSLLRALELGETLADDVERSTRQRFGVPLPDRSPPDGATWRPESGPMALAPDVVAARDRLHCWTPGPERYPRRHGSYGERD